MINQKRLLNEFFEIVKISSPSRKEKPVAEYLLKSLRNLGLNVIVDRVGEKVGGNTGNVIVTLNGNRENVVPIMFAAHMDTVQTDQQNIIPVLKKNKISSKNDTILGADDKAAVAALLEVIKVIKEKNIKHGSLEFLFTISEESGLLGSKNLDIQKIKSKFCFVLDSEGPVGNVVIQGPSRNQINFIFKGRASHAGLNPEEGINAIKIASVAISK